jgi:hypothetical protein
MEESRFFEARWFLGFSLLELKEVIIQLIAYVRRPHGLIIAGLTAEEVIRRSFSQGKTIEVAGTFTAPGMAKTRPQPVSNFGTRA